MILKTKIRYEYERSRQLSGYRKIYHALKARNVPCRANRILKLMKESATVIHLFSRKVIGWAMNKKMESSVVEKALLMALWSRKPNRDYSLIHHSDRGSQYASHTFENLLKIHKIKCTMSRKGDCCDNTVAESFFNIIKTELIYQNSFKTRTEARHAIFEYIEVFYNQVRLHRLYWI